MLTLTSTYSLFHLAKMAPAHLVSRMKSNFFGTQNVLRLIIKSNIIACRDDTMKVRLIKRNKQRILAPEFSKIVLICVTKVIDGLSLGDWRAVCERAVGFGDKGQVLVVLGLECRLAPFSHLKPTLVVVVGVVCTHAHTDKHTRTRAGTHRMATIIRPRGSHTGAEHYTEKSRCGRRIFVIISQYGGGG